MLANEISIQGRPLVQGVHIVSRIYNLQVYLLYISIPT